MSKLAQPKGDAERAVVSGQKSATILVVDDQPPSRQFLTTLLTYKGHRLLEASDGAEALARVRVAKYGGAGLGVTIAKQLVALMGGKIWEWFGEGFNFLFHSSTWARSSCVIA